MPVTSPPNQASSPCCVPVAGPATSDEGPRPGDTSGEAPQARVRSAWPSLGTGLATTPLAERPKNMPGVPDGAEGGRGLRECCEAYQ